MSWNTFNNGTDPLVSFWKDSVMTRILVGIIAIGAIATSLWAVDPDKKGDREGREQAFATKLTGSTLAGSFSIDGKDAGANKPDRYQIVSAKKVQGDDWIITSKMKVGENQIDVPIPIKIYWADDTLVMSLTDLTIPGVGTFTARVMFHGNRYAGTWQHGEVGGHMWGMIEAAPAKK
jgi:hypothetical protein